MSMVWLVKGTNRPPLAVLYAFYRQRVSLVFEKSESCHYFEVCHHCKWGFFEASYAFSFLFSILLWYASWNWWGLCNIICSFTPFDYLWVCALLTWTWVLSLCPSFPHSWVLCLIEFTMISSISRWTNFDHFVVTKFQNFNILCNVFFLIVNNLHGLN